MKKLSLLLVFIIMLGAFSACAGIGDETLQVDSHSPSFELSYEISRREYTRGETVSITARVKNISGCDLTYTAVNDSYYPTVELYSPSEGDGMTTNIPYEPIVTSTGSSEFTAKAGQVGEKTYTFIIPEDAVLGSYSITLNYRGDVCTYTDALMILAETSQNENDEYDYSPISLISGGELIKPIRMLVGGFTQNADGTGMECDGAGVSLFWGNEKLLPTIPMLVYEDGIGVDIPEYNEIQGVSIYDLEWERLNSYNNTSLGELDYLAAGDYIVVLSVQYNTRPRNPNEYENYSYDDIFRLIVPSKPAEKTEYNFSSVTIRSGEDEINPIQCMLWIEEHTKQGVLNGDGFGVSQIIENKADHSDFPTLFYRGSIQAYPPVNAYLTRVEIYDTDYNKLDHSFDSIEQIRYLLPGEYLVTFYEELDGRGCEPESTEYTIRANECIFKFIVPESSIGSFAFDNIRRNYKAGDPGVKTDGFKNTSESPVTNIAEAVERAKRECTIGYDTVTLLRDGWEGVWSVMFSTRGTLGGCQTVYLDSKGVTLLIVYGE